MAGDRTAAAERLQTPEEYAVYGDAPRLFLRPARARLLRRERERDSIRWQQFDALISGKAALPEPAFAYALHYQASAAETSARTAIAAALRPGVSIRDAALVFDWCSPAMTEREAAQLASVLARSLQRPAKPGFDIPDWRDRALAAIALGAQLPDRGESVLKMLVERWRSTVLPAMRSGADPVPARNRYALAELLHAIRDTLEIDLRDGAKDYFRELPVLHLHSHYPAPLPTVENEYRIPLLAEGAEPDLREAALSRAAGLALVAYDNNLLEHQFLQGWLVQDRFLMRGGFGIPYEFLWANPYQPGLSYAHLPLLLHYPKRGLLLARSSWEEDAEWIGFLNGTMQYFENGKLAVFRPSTKPKRVGPAKFLLGQDRMQLTLDEPEPVTIFLLNLKPNQLYEIEVDDEEMTERRADAGGVLALPFTTPVQTGIRFRPAAR